MDNYLSLCIWGYGPGRPYDNTYILKRISFNDNTLHLIFQEDEECIISNPQCITVSEKGIKIGSADKIIWRFYFYGKPKSKENVITTEYTMINPAHVHFLEKGAFNSEKIIPIKDVIAFDSFGDISFLRNELKTNY